MAFRWDMRNKTPQQQAIVSVRDRATVVERNNEKCSSRERTVKYSVAMFMKLGLDATGEFDGFGSIEKYIKCIEEHGATWFSTNALTTGISKKKQEEFLTAIHAGKRVEIYFVIGKSGGGSNKIEFRADVIDLKSNREGLTTPDDRITPEQWCTLVNTIWIKIKNLQVCKDKKVEAFKFASNGNQLIGALQSNCCFGYITEV